MVSID
jgi:DNA repair protein RAD50